MAVKAFDNNAETKNSQLIVNSTENKNSTGLIRKWERKQGKDTLCVSNTKNEEHLQISQELSLLKEKLKLKQIESDKFQSMFQVFD